MSLSHMAVASICPDNKPLTSCLWSNISALQLILATSSEKLLLLELRVENPRLNTPARLCSNDRGAAAPAGPADPAVCLPRGHHTPFILADVLPDPLGRQGAP